MIPEFVEKWIEEKFLGDKGLARKAFEDLFETLHKLEERGEEAVRRKDEAEIAWTLSEIQQLICWSPLRLFLWEFTKFPSLWVRAAAKGEIADQKGEFWDDPEVVLITQANLFTMFQPREDFRIWFGSQKLEKILASSIEAGLPIPRLKIF
jgi:hypothetical protein